MEDALDDLIWHQSLGIEALGEDCLDLKRTLQVGWQIGTHPTVRMLEDGDMHVVVPKDCAWKRLALEAPLSTLPLHSEDPRAFVEHLPIFTISCRAGACTFSMLDVVQELHRQEIKPRGSGQTEV